MKSAEKFEIKKDEETKTIKAVMAAPLKKRQLKNPLLRQSTAKGTAKTNTASASKKKQNK